ncbi:MAG: hypothetical protein ISR61_03560 [Desulfobacteraceae bacterium]|uniref:Uncharacterized protein n=1 Tax=Candidatus Desulfacyla euxinica TaxID=2841693 RepID=A0A8J6MYU2_9DELT|nr:hypothetical protein [Candidatus Desulfacyla euxinica]MBL6978000.1 hypothetical protein [Desulfobacteraceae bacterium]
MSVKLSQTAAKSIKNLTTPDTRNLEYENREHVDPRLVDYDREIDICIESFNREGISLMDFPEATRHRAFVIEQELTRTANENRSDEFMKYLKDWRMCFH